MKTVIYLLLTGFGLLLLQSCSSGDDNTNLVYVGEVPDQALTAFRNLEAVYTFADSSQQWLRMNYFHNQQYRESGSDQLFSGTLTSESWLDSLDAEAVFEEGYIRRFTNRFPNGEKSSEVNVTGRDHGAPVVHIQTWHYNGNVRSEGTPEMRNWYFEDGRPDRIEDSTSITNYWENGNRQAMWSYEKGMEGDNPHGPSKIWWENGQLGMEGNYVNGSRDGEWFYYDSTGTPDKTEIYRGGELDTTIVHS